MRSLWFAMTLAVLQPAALESETRTEAGQWPQPERAQLERILLENIIPFWYPAALDRDLGGFKLNHGLDGAWLGPAPKGIVTQARTVWFFSRLARSPYGRPEHLDAARHGFRFLRDRLWDQRHGGFFWAVSADGSQALQPMKHLYGQAFGLYALAEYYRASRDRDAQVLAASLFGLLEKHAHDRIHGGYREFFNPDWTDPEEQPGYMGVLPDIKLMNTHLHLMEALAAYHRVERSPLVRERLLELIQIQSNSVVRKTWGACTDRHHRDWTPVLGPEAEVASYGHDLENIWLLMDAAESAGISDGPLLDLYRTLFDYSLRWGWDAAAGGFYYTGPLGRTAEDREKSWWVQAEVLVSSLRMFRRTADPKYQDVFRKTLGWVVDHQVDGERGEWFAAIRPDGTPDGVKAGLWKSPYHNGRAMLECLEQLAR
ncbi:MAG: cellobiose 2-epimerase [Acidobacteriota bacterium]